jgi:integrative and conjugative element protein (TIGR02256 family)
MPRSWRRRKLTVWLPRDAQAKITRQISNAEPDETGGILLGYEVLADAAVVVTHLVGPGPNSRATRAHFDPDGRWQEKEVARIYEESGRHAKYLGDWHSHPDGAARPSRKDRRTARSIAQHAAARMPTPLMLIVASSDASFRLACFRYSRRKLRRLSLRLYD